MTTTPSIAWIGLGAIGAPMARTAAEAGFTVTAFDLSPDARQALADVTMPAETALAAAQGADVVVIMVATPEQLDSVLFGDGGIAPALTARTTLLIMSTVGPTAIDDTVRALEDVTGHIVDAPVSGGAARAAQGDLLVMVGGAQTDVETIRPVLDALASTPPWSGPDPATVSASRSSTSCCAACTSPRPGRPWRSLTRWAWI